MDMTEDWNRLRRYVEAVRTINADNRPLRELLDQILSERPEETAVDRGRSAAGRQEVVSPPSNPISLPATPSPPLAPRPKLELPPRPLEERQIASAGSWAIATDGLQWIVQRYRGNRWRNLKFVRTTKFILARCLREAGATPDAIDALLADLPDQFSDMAAA